MKPITYLLALLLSSLLAAAQANTVAERIHRSGPSKDRRLPIDVKLKKNGRVCDACEVPFAFSSDFNFSYVIVGTPHLPDRLYGQAAALRRRSMDSITSVHFTPHPTIALFLLPNYPAQLGEAANTRPHGKELDYGQGEYEVWHNNKRLTGWTSLNSAKTDDEYAIIKRQDKPGGGEDASQRFETVFVGKYRLEINDSLKIFIRDVNTKKIERGIFIRRLLGKATHFTYVQLPKLTSQHDNSLQNFLNATIQTKNAVKGNRSLVFEKDDDKIGIFSFEAGLADVVEFSFDDTLHWQALQPGNLIDPEGRIYLVIDHNIAAGETKDLYLRYQHQPETVHKITVKAKPDKHAIPWTTIAVVITALLMLIAGGLYVWHRRQKKRLAALDARNKDIGTRLALLSGQLNPHFLFNTLHAIQGTINSNNIDEANRHIDSVATLMRNIMDQGQKEFISLEEELKLETNFLQLEQKRKNFRFEIESEAQIEQAQVDFPPLLLQPVLENSVRHAFGQKEDPFLKISILSVENDLIVEITDNGPGWDAGEYQEGHGIGLVRKRIELINKKVQTMRIEMHIAAVKNAGVTTTFLFKDWLT